MAERKVQCGVCKGTGMKGDKECKKCGGAGEITIKGV